MNIWFNKELSLEKLKPLGANTMSEFLGIVWIEVGENFIKATMPVGPKTNQPYGYLHGGASCVLAETLGSIASALVVDDSKYFVVGLEINANHIRSAKEGIVTGIVTPIHIGSSTHVWDIKIIDEKEKLICISRLTVAVLNRKV